jgi:hypothetical protein
MLMAAVPDCSNDSHCFHDASSGALIASIADRKHIRAFLVWFINSRCRAAFETSQLSMTRQLFAEVAPPGTLCCCAIELPVAGVYRQQNFLYLK